MIVIYNMYVKAKTPKFMDRTLNKFLMAENACFLTREDLDIFIGELTTLVEHDRPIGSTYRVTDFKEALSRGRSGQVSVERSDLPDMIMARFQYKEYKSILRWSPETNKFINVIYRVED